MTTHFLSFHYWLEAAMIILVFAGHQPCAGTILTLHRAQHQPTRQALSYHWPGENRLGEVQYLPVHTARKRQYLDLKLSLCLIKAFFPWNPLPDSKKVLIIHTGVFQERRGEREGAPKTQIVKKKNTTISVTLQNRPQGALWYSEVTKSGGKSPCKWALRARTVR